MSNSPTFQEASEWDVTKHLFAGLVAGNLDAIAYQLECKTKDEPVRATISDSAMAAFFRGLARKLSAIDHGDVAYTFHTKSGAMVPQDQYREVSGDLLRVTLDLADYGRNLSDNDDCAFCCGWMNEDGTRHHEDSCIVKEAMPVLEMEVSKP